MKKYIPSLNGLRALSIFFVVYSHVLIHNFNKQDNPGGQIGVNIFFIISGYLITVLLINEENNTNTISLKGFYLRRTIRIFPVYYFLLFVYFILQVAGILNFTGISWITSLTYTKYIKASDVESMHFWSLSIEEQFYLIWPLVFKYLKKIRIGFAFLVIISVTLVRLLSNVSDMHMFTRADALMWGCIFAIYNEKLAQLLKEVQRKNSLFILIPFILLFVCMITKRVFTLPVSCANAIRAFIGSFGLITDIAVGFIILVSVYSSDNIWFNFLNSKPMNYIGKLSYSIYLWQQLFFSKAIDPFSKFPYNILLIFIVANMSYNFIEKPALKLKHKFLTN